MRRALCPRWMEAAIGGLIALALGATPAPAQPADSGAERRPGDRRFGEEEQITAREEWFVEQRGLDLVYRPEMLRAAAIAELRQAMEEQASLAVPGAWQPLGPSPMNMLSWAMGRVAGRVSALAVSTATEQTLYLGTASGGLWKTLDGGASWTSIFDSIGTQTIGSLALDPNNSNTLWVGTGEQRQSCLSYFGMGLFRSIDAGATFTARNGSGSSTLDLSWVTAVAVQPGSSSVVLAGGPGQCVGGTSVGGGLYRSTDGGGTWTKVLNGQTNDIVFDPVSPATVYAAVGTGTSDSNAGVFRSTNGGATWTLLGSGIPSGSAAGRIRLAMAPTNRLVLYALVNRSGTTTGLYRTLDGGSTWSLRNGNACEGQCTYNLTLAVSPTSSSTLVVGSIRIFRSTNSGTTLTALTSTWGSSQRVHQDTHVVRFSATNGSRFWIGSDGGLWRTDNSGSTYANLNANLNITQLYDVAVHPSDGSRLLGGAQDNSSEGRATSAVWDVVTVTGDGFVNAFDQANPSYAFIESYPTSTGPNIYRSTSGGGVGTFSTLPKTGIGSGASSFPFKTELALVPGGSTSYLVTGSTHLYRANARAGTVSWAAVSTNLAGTGVLSALGTTGGGTLYAGFQNGRIFRTGDVLAGSVAWSEVTGSYPGGWVSDLAVDPTNVNRVFATRSAFGGSKLYRSTTGGTTWAAVGSGLPDVPANSVAIDPLNLSRVFVATDVGVYVSEDGGDIFVPQMAGLPLGAVATDLEIDGSPHLLTLATYGRGAWQLALP